MLKSRDAQIRSCEVAATEMKSGSVPLVAAAAANDLGQIAALIAGGADPNEVATAEMGWRATAVGIAATLGHAEALVLLGLDRGRRRRLQVHRKSARRRHEPRRVRGAGGSRGLPPAPPRRWREAPPRVGSRRGRKLRLQHRPRLQYGFQDLVLDLRIDPHRLPARRLTSRLSNTLLNLVTEPRRHAPQLRRRQPLHVPRTQPSKSQRLVAVAPQVPYS